MNNSNTVPHTQQFLFNPDENWLDWRWQQKNALRDEAALRSACGGWSDEVALRIQQNLQGQKMQITPYYLRQILATNQSDDITANPLWRQVVPFWSEEELNGYDGETENWELNDEMKTPICQHKYANRVILRMVNACNSYCQFCFEALRTLKVDSGKSNAGRSSFQQSLEYIKKTPSVEEVILSGGDPLMLTDNKLDESLAAIRKIRDDLLIRIHSRALTFNPYRITDALIETLKNTASMPSVFMSVIHLNSVKNFKLPFVASKVPYRLFFPICLSYVVSMITKKHSTSCLSICIAWA
ncbi:KamA family radical SAM protein [Xenorhabdus bovienii]|uniref:KamA family radical SAM protein n=1 Tax=Xenorhabdus bovienii TaxID=40576 RepID=UPI0023B2550B|nr:radical SAM protein [Xenorhabdus bovienii]